MNSPVVARLREFNSTIFTEMTLLAQRTGALNLGQGFPDSDGPPAMLAAAAEAIAAGRNQYPPGAGIPELRTAIAAQRAARYGVSYDVDSEILVTAGATEGIAAALLGLVEPDDEVLVFEPYYDSYAAGIAMAGGRRRAVLLEFDGTRFAVNADALRAAVTPRTRFVLVNTPHNPTGTVFTRAELEEIAAVCREHDLIAITDEVYEYLLYDGLTHVPLASLPGMAERTLTVSSAGKTFSVTGWKIGWVCGPAALVSAARTAKQYLTFASGTPFQVAVAYALQHELGWVEALRVSLQQRRDLLTGVLRQAGLTVYPAQGTYFVNIDARSLGAADGGVLCRELPERAGVVAVPAVEFYDTKEAGRHLVRLAFCKDESILTEAARRLAGAVSTRGGSSG